MGNKHPDILPDLGSQAEHTTTGSCISPEVPLKPTVCGLFQGCSRYQWVECWSGTTAGNCWTRTNLPFTDFFKEIKEKQIMAQVICNLDSLCSCSTLLSPIAQYHSQRLPEPLQGKGQLCCPSQCCVSQHTGQGGTRK